MRKTTNTKTKTLHLSTETIKLLDPAKLAAIVGGQDLLERKAGASRYCE